MIGAKMRGLAHGQKAALIVSECQSAIVDPYLAMFPGLAKQVVARDILHKIATLAAACRAAHVPVIHCTVRLLPEASGFAVVLPLRAAMKHNILLRSDRVESTVHPSRSPHASDFVSERHRGIMGFHGTDLGALLRGLDVETVILSGVSTHIAPPGMAIAAINRGFAVIIPEDCTAGSSSDAHEHAVRHIFPILATVTNSVDIIAQLRTPEL